MPTTPRPHALGFLTEELQTLERAGLRRTLLPIASPSGPELELEDGERLVNFSSNDYLGLAGHPDVVRAAREAALLWGLGTGAARLVVGNPPPYEALEDELAAFLDVEAVLVFNSGYHANTGVIPALAGRGDHIVSDALNHASIIDGTRLSRADVTVVPHRDLDAFERAMRRPARRTWVVTDALFSMDGDRAPLRALRDLCDTHGALLYVDEAHAIGAIGPSGRGACEEAGVRADVHMGTFGKAFGTYGAYVAGPRVLRDHLLHRARSFVFTTGLPAPVVAATLRSLQLLRQHPELRTRLSERIHLLLDGLRALGLPTPSVPSPILPIRIGDAHAALRASERLRELGLLVRAIRPPTVAPGTSRLRVAISAAHTPTHIERLLVAIDDLITSGHLPLPSDTP